MEIKISIEEIVKKEYTENDETLCFKTTPLAKIIVLSMLSYGIYLFILIWGYWKILKENFGYKVSPFWRAWFAFITNFSLFPILGKYFKNYNIKIFNTYFLAFLCFILTFLLHITSYGNGKFLIIFDLFVVFALTLILVNFQNKINKINKEFYPNAPKNGWKISNIVWIILFLILIYIILLP